MFLAPLAAKLGASAAKSATSMGISLVKNGFEEGKKQLQDNGMRNLQELKEKGIEKLQTTQAKTTEDIIGKIQQNGALSLGQQSDVSSLTSNTDSTLKSLAGTLGVGKTDDGSVSSESASSGSPVGSDAETEVANNIMCKGFQELFTKNQAKYNEFLFRSLENYFTEGHTKSMLDKMLNRNMGEYIKSNQFGGIVKSEIQKSIGSVMQSTLKSELRNRKNYSGMCNEIDKLNMKRRGGGTIKTRTKTRTRDPSKKRRTFKRRN